MTKNEFDCLKEGDEVWFHPVYFTFALPGIIRKHDGRNGIFINFYGDGQCLFLPESLDNHFYNHIYKVGL